MADGDTERDAHAANSGAACVIIRAECRAGREAAVEALLNDHARKVREHERGCTSYVVTRQLGSKRHFAAIARFSAWEAFKAHGETAHLGAILPRLDADLATPVSIEIFFEV